MAEGFEAEDFTGKENVHFGEPGGVTQEQQDEQEDTEEPLDLGPSAAREEVVDTQYLQVGARTWKSHFSVIFGDYDFVIFGGIGFLVILRL